MERDNLDNPVTLVELGSVSGDTQGGPGNHWEGTGFEPRGLSAD